MQDVGGERKLWGGSAAERKTFNSGILHRTSREGGEKLASVGLNSGKKKETDVETLGWMRREIVG